MSRKIELFKNVPVSKVQYFQTIDKLEMCEQPGRSSALSRRLFIAQATFYSILPLAVFVRGMNGKVTQTDNEVVGSWGALVGKLQYKRSLATFEFIRLNLYSSFILPLLKWFIRVDNHPSVNQE